MIIQYTLKVAGTMTFEIDSDIDKEGNGSVFEAIVNNPYHVMHDREYMIDDNVDYELIDYDVV